MYTLEKTVSGKWYCECKHKCFDKGNGRAVTLTYAGGDELKKTMGHFYSLDLTKVAVADVIKAIRYKMFTYRNITCQLLLDAADVKGPAVVQDLPTKSTLLQEVYHICSATVKVKEHPRFSLKENDPASWPVRNGKVFFN